MTPNDTQRRTRSKPELRRAQILDEAVGLIAERGYYGFGIRELADRCGLTNPGVLHHFGSKDQLLIALLEDRDRRVQDAVFSAIENAGFVGKALSFSETLQLFHITAVQAEARPELLRLYAILQSEALNEAHPAHQFFAERQARVVRSYAALVEAFVAEPESTALHLVATIDGLQEEWLRAKQGFDLVEELDRAIKRILAARTVS
ncbi:helix-turn-helix domain containing protein [Phenylobacterium sp. LjRoot219]|uniref:TetR/AcrR family transcriptional regulator n=1 Tax=Phenylobacterium sp. LjRoot219 TaxID=3342283 RepID=UPI003ED142E0